MGKRSKKKRRRDKKSMAERADVYALYQEAVHAVRAQVYGAFIWVEEAVLVPVHAIDTDEEGQ